jgi:ABC-2 type transport system permease protein
MYSLFIKEINSFFSGITGWLVIVVFLLTTSLFLWVFPGDMNILESGYSTLEPLFFIAPWVFLFLVPAVTMRMFADEKKSGTLELLLTKPLTEFQIVLAKYLAAVVLVLLSLLPALIFYWSVYQLGNPVGNIDTGATWGSFIGLFFLASIYAAIGLFASSLSDNQIISFIIAVALCFLLFMGFDSIGSLAVFSSLEDKIIALGINEHYKSISKGVLEIKDVAYFICAASIFLIGTRTVLQSRK